MIQSFPTSHWQSSCHLRRARAQDGQQIRALTRKLHQIATTQPPWHAWVAGFMVSLTIVMFWHYPNLMLALTISSAPLALMILVTALLGKHEQQQQCERYWVMEYQSQIIGCGRIDIHKHHAEIYDLFVLSTYRSRGVGQAIMQQLIAQAPRPIYLASLPSAIPFYHHLGFEPIAARELPLLVASRLSLNSPRYRQVGLQPMVLQLLID
jgi:N-acetylglutamate synthase-like GNAT family acetyltransferase